MQFANDNYAVEHRHGCTVVFGSITLDAMKPLSAKAGGRRARVDIESARLLGASMVFGLPHNIAHLRNALVNKNHQFAI